MTLDEYLTSRGITEKAFGLSINVSQQTVHRYRSGTRKPSPVVARKIEDATEGLVRKETLRPDLWSEAA